MDPMTAYLVTVQRQHACASRSALPHAPVTAHDPDVWRTAAARAVLAVVTMLASWAVRRSARPQESRAGGAGT
jgi:hypothetical protein